MVSDYRFRGFSQSDEGPALQGGVDFTSGAFYGGGSPADFARVVQRDTDKWARLIKERKITGD